MATSPEPAKHAVTLLMSYGLDRALAERLSAKKYNVTKLKALSDEKIIALVGPEIAPAFRTGYRPPIPNETLAKLLHESRWTCCICRERRGSIIVHHIVEWSVTHDHGEENLVVLCLDHHGEAHTTRELGMNLTAARLREQKAEWTKQVRQADADVISNAGNIQDAHWDFFHHERLHTMLAEAQISIPKDSELCERGVLDETGALRDPSLWIGIKPSPHYLYEHSPLSRLYQYNRLATHRVIRHFGLTHITNMSPLQLRIVLRTNMIIAAQGTFRFKMQDAKREWRQMRLGYRKARGVRLEFLFDAWHATFASSWYGYLSNSSSVTVIGTVRELRVEGKLFKVQITPLAIGTGFEDLVEAPSNARRYFGAIEDAELVPSDYVPEEEHSLEKTDDDQNVESGT